MATSTKGNYAPVNGINLYYETHGTGDPLVILHGGFGTAETFAPLAAMPSLADNHQVIVVELQGHGHTADIDRPLSFEYMADDIAALIKHLGLDNAGVLGYSLGGGVAIQTAIRHPELVRKLVIISAPFKRDGWYPEDLAGMAMVNGEAAKTWLETPMYKAYADAAPNPDDWSALADKLGTLLRTDYDWTSDAAALKMPVLVIVGDGDGIRLEHAVEMLRLVDVTKSVGVFESMPASQLAVLAATTHLNMLERTELLLPTIQRFLNAPMPGAA